MPPRPRIPPEVLRQLIAEAMKAPAPPPPREPSPLERIGGLGGVMAGGTRAISGAASAMGGPIGAGISGGGEALAELFEGTLGKKPGRIAMEAVLGLIPFGAVLKAGRPLASAVRGGLYSGVGEAGREIAREQELDPKAITAQAGLGGGLTAGLAKLFGLKPPARAGGYEIEATAQPGGTVLGGGKVRTAPSTRMGVQKTTLTGAKPMAVGKMGIIPGQVRPLTPPAGPVSETGQIALPGIIPESPITAPGQVTPELARLFNPEAGGIDPLAMTSPRVQRIVAGEQRAADIARRQLIRDKVGEERSFQQWLREKIAETRAYNQSQKLLEDERKLAEAQRIQQEAMQGKLPVTSVSETTVGVPVTGGTRRATTRFRVKKPEDVPKDVSVTGSGGVSPDPNVPRAPRGPSADPTLEIGARQVGKGAKSLEEQLNRWMSRPEAPLPPNLVGAVDELPEAVTDPALASALGVQPEALRFLTPGLGADPKPLANLLGQSKVDISGEKGLYGFLKGARAAGEKIPVQAERIAGQALRREAKVAGLPTGKAAQVRSPVESTPSWVQEQLDALEAIKRGGGETGAASQELLLSLGLGAGGAAIGAAWDPFDDRVASALTGAVVGAVIPQIASKIMSRTGGAPPIPPPTGMPPTVAESISMAMTPEGVKKATMTIAEYLPQIVRANLLTSPNLFNNAIAAPWGAGVLTALELIASGDPRGYAFLHEMHPEQWGRGFGRSWNRAAELISGEGRAETGELIGQAPNVWRRIVAAPGTIITMGDVTTREAAIRAGLSEEMARAITLTKEPETAFGRGIVNIARSGPMGQMFLPFSRTLVNVMEQGLARTPGVGSVYERMPGLFGRKVTGSPTPLRQELVRQGIGGGVGLGAGLVGTQEGDIDNPLLQRTLKSLTTNIAGPYALLAGAGYAGGRALSRGAAPADMAREAGKAALQETPLPTTEVPMSFLNFLFGEEGQRSIPTGMLPGVLRAAAQEYPDLARTVGLPTRTPQRRLAQARKRKPNQ